MSVVGVIANPTKTLGGGLDALRAGLARRGVAEPLWRESPGSDAVPGLVAELVDAGVDLLFVWGGDGTVQQCVAAVGDAPVALAVLPAGTANLLAGNLGIPTDLEKAVDIGLTGRRRRIDLGTVNGERFAVMAGVGFDAVMIRSADGGLKDTLGRLGYVAAGVAGIARSPVQTRVEIDGAAWFDGPAACVLVGNMGDLFGGISAFPDASADDGLLDVGVITADRAVDWVRTIGRVAIGDAASSPFVETATASAIDVRLGDDLPYELDGEPRPETEHVSFRVQPAAITVCTPTGGEER